MAVSRRLRFEVLRRDNHACRYCGRSAPEVALTVDHVVPVALGGGDLPENLATACRECNAGKTSTTPDAPLVADVQADALRWGRAMARAAEIRAREHYGRDVYTGWLDEAWLDWTYNGEHFERPAAWQPAIWRFWDLGIPRDELADCVRRAMANDRVRADQVWCYFLGVVWRRYEEQADLAKRLIDEEEGSNGT